MPERDSFQARRSYFDGGRARIGWVSGTRKAYSCRESVGSVKSDGVGCGEGRSGSKGIDPVPVLEFACEVRSVAASVPRLDAEERSIALRR